MLVSTYKFVLHLIQKLLTYRPMLFHFNQSQRISIVSPSVGSKQALTKEKGCQQLVGHSISHLLNYYV